MMLLDRIYLETVASEIIREKLCVTQIQHGCTIYTNTYIFWLLPGSSPMRSRRDPVGRVELFPSGNRLRAWRYRRERH
jgi:hypothetical protein